MTRADIEAWDTTHLETAATLWRSTAAHWVGHFETIHAGMLRPGGTTWEGTAADAAAERSWGDLVKVRGAGDALYAAAGHATTGAGDIAWAKRKVLDAITEAEEAGFTVGQDFSVTDKSWSLLRSSVVRQQQAQAFATEISTRVRALVAIDQQVATQISGALVPLEGMKFTEPESAPTPVPPEKDHGPVVHAAGYGIKQDVPPPTPAAPPGPNAADMKGVLDKLPQGSKPNIREVRTPEDLQALKRWMTQGGVDGQNRYGDPGRGAWKVLADGSEVGERYAAKSTGTNSLDIDLKSANGAEHWKVHINPQTGGVPELPAPKAPVIEPQAPKATPAEPNSPKAPVTERAPNVRVRGGWGGPSAEPFGPQPVHPPGSIHHHFPILGVDDPGENPRDFEGHS